MTRIILDYNARDEAQLEEYMAAVPERQRYLLFTNKINPIARFIKYETDEKLCYFIEKATPRFGTRGFIQRRAKHGFSFDKIKEKLSIWYGQSLQRVPQGLTTLMLSDLGMDWANQMHVNLRLIVTRSLMEKIIRGKITSPIEYIEQYLKSTVRIKSLSAQLYYKLITYTKDPESRSKPTERISPYQLNSFLKFSKDPNWTLEHFDHVIKNVGEYSYQPILNLCRILNVKIDWSISKDDLQKEIKRMELELEAYDLLHNEGSSVFGKCDNYANKMFDRLPIF